jgi:hypothetical protein
MNEFKWKSDCFYFRVLYDAQTCVRRNIRAEISIKLGVKFPLYFLISS